LITRVFETFVHTSFDKINVITCYLVFD